MPPFDEVEADVIDRPVSSVARPAALNAKSRQADKKFNHKRALKISFALSILGVAFYACLSQGAYVATSQAVVTAPAVALRAPITGNLSPERFHVGDMVREGEVFAFIDDPLLDRRPVFDLFQRLNVDRAAITADLERLDSLAAMQGELERRVGTHWRAAATLLAAQQQEATHNLDAQRWLAGADIHESGRQSTLARQGWSSLAAAERQKALAMAANQQAGARISRLEALKAEGQALGARTYLNNGGNDVPYSQQRLDEVSLRQQDAAHDFAIHTAEANELTRELGSVTTWNNQAGHNEAKTPVAGMVYMLQSFGGERVGAGDTIAKLVDCRQAFIIVSIAQGRLPDVILSAPVHFRLEGDATDRTGHVAAVTSENPAAAVSLAAVPPQSTGVTATVRVAMDDTGTGSECLVGRTARVLVPTRDGSLLSVLFAFIDSIL